MHRSIVVLVAFLSLSSIAIASQPAQLIDCSDWVAVDPNLRCRAFAQCEYDGPNQVEFPCSWYGGGNQATPDGLVVGIFYVTLPDFPCWMDGARDRMEVRVTDGSVTRTLGYFDHRCHPNGNGTDSIRWHGSIFDATSGRLIMYVASECQGPLCEIGKKDWVVAIEGFTTTFEVMETFTPSASTLGLKAPVMPDGLRGADRFDTYWGTVARPLDLSQAHPLQCAYPDHQPQVGEYLTFPDAAPTPAPGQAIYYLTSVTYQGQTRAGRQALDGRLTGRDATALPACIVEKQAAR